MSYGADQQGPYRRIAVMIDKIVKVGSLSANLQRFEFEKVAKIETLQGNHWRNE